LKRRKGKKELERRKGKFLVSIKWLTNKSLHGVGKP
jgi:hypothetical protein